MRFAFALALGLIIVVALAAACGDDSTETASPITWTASPITETVGPFTETLHFTRAGHDVTLDVAVADELEERAQGLMNVPSLPDDAGMLFVWPEDTLSGFWMKDTVIPLSIAFVTAGGVIVDIQDMEPLSEELITPQRSYRYAVEVNQGWFTDNSADPVGGWVVAAPSPTYYAGALLAPDEAAGGSGMAWVTGDAGGPSSAEAFDCDGVVYLISPTWDGTGGATILSFDYWTHNRGLASDELRLQVTNATARRQGHRPSIARMLTAR